MILRALLLAAWTCAFAAPSSDKSPDPQWAARMQNFYKTLADLLNDVSSDRRYYDKENLPRIEKESEELKTLAHGLTAKPALLPDMDPSMQIFSGVMTEELELATNALKKGYLVYARGILKSVPSYCIACHTRNQNSGPEFSKLTIEPNPAWLSDIGMADFYAATRQFDRAQELYKKIIQNKGKTRSGDWQKAIREDLLIAVRVKNDPKNAREVVNTVLSLPDLPMFLKQDAESWLVTIREWEKEPQKKLKSIPAIRSEALRLMLEAKKRQKYPMDHNADILYLRASAVVHRLLQAGPEGEKMADALYLAGLSYDVLNTLRFDRLPDIYFVACIRQSPHSVIAERCYQNYERNVFIGYSGTAGLDLPEDVRAKLMDLEKMARVEPIKRK